MVRIVQLLCEERHCLLASAYEDDEGTFTKTCQALSDLLQPKGWVRRHCGICGSAALHFEVGLTKFKTLAEAMPTIMECQSEQMQTRTLLDDLGLSFEQAGPAPNIKTKMN